MMDCKVEKMDAFKVIGMARTYSFENSFKEIPMFWGEFNAQYAENLYHQIPEACIGMYGVCLEPVEGSNEFKYLIAGDYKGGKVPEGLEVVELPAYIWAKFKCVGPMPHTLQQLNQRIYSEWVPNNPKYALAAGLNIEVYSMGDPSSETYESEIWVPVKEK